MFTRTFNPEFEESLETSQGKGTLLPDKFCDAQISMFYCSVCVKEMPDMKLILIFTCFILMACFQIKEIVMHLLLSLYLESLVSRYM